MKTGKIDFSKIGTSIANQEFAEKTRQYFLKKKEYWEQFDQKKGNHTIIKSMLMDMEELSGEFLIVPRFLEQFFLLYLNKHHPSQQNSQLALNVARVFAVLKSATQCNMTASFYVSPSVWEKWLVGRKAKESSIAILEKMGMIISYHFNRNKFAPTENPRIVTMYQFNLDKVKWLHGCVKTMAALEDTKQDEICEEREHHFSYADIEEDLSALLSKRKELRLINYSLFLLTFKGCICRLSLSFAALLSEVGVKFVWVALNDNGFFFAVKCVML